MNEKLGSLLCFGGCGILGYLLYQLVQLVINGAIEQNLWLLVGGGILLALFGVMLVGGIILLFWFAMVILLEDW